MGIRLFLAPIIFFLALVVLRMHVWLRDAWRTRSPQQTGKRLQVTGGILFGAGGVGLSLLALAIATSFNWDHLDFMIAMTVYLWLPMTVTGVLVVFLGGRIGRGVSVADDALLDGLRISGWVLLGLAVMSVLPIWCLVLAPIPLIMIFFSVYTNRRFERQRQLMSLLTVSIQNLHPLPDEIAAYARGQGSRYARQLAGLELRLREGVSLPDALARVPGLFPQETIDTIRLAASTGSLDKALPQAALLQEARLQKRNVQRMRFADIVNLVMSYLLIISLVCSFLMYWIVPKYKAIFDGFGMALPVSTISLIRMSDFFVDYAVLIMFPLMGLMFGVVFWISGYQRGPFRWLPNSLLAFGRSLNPRGVTQRLLDQLMLITSHGIPIPAGLKSLAAAPSYLGVKQRLLDVAQDAEQGNDIWEALRRNRLLTTAECGLLQAAQKLKNLPWTLQFIADGLERRSLSRLELFRISLHTICLLSIGLVVGWFAIGFFEPLLQMLKGLS